MTPSECLGRLAEAVDRQLEVALVRGAQPVLR
jgi:hypothetical protein